MDIFEFVARSEWPLLAGATVWLLRQPIREMMRRVSLTKIDAWGLKAEFEKGLDKVEALTPTPTDKTPRKITMEAETGKYELKISAAALSKNSPEMVVLDAWRELEGSMRKMVDAERPSRVGNIAIPPLRMEEAARRLGLSDDDVESLKVLRKLRNEVAHNLNVPLTWQDAIRFHDAVQNLLARMIEGQKSSSKLPSSSDEK